MNPSLIARLLSTSATNHASGCIEWQNTITRHGYGKTKVMGRTMPAHRAMWTAVHGSIPAGMLVCHRCDNRKCLNVDHLFLGTPKDNMVDKMAKGRWRGGPACWSSARVSSNGGLGVGSLHHSAKLTEEKVRLIKDMVREGGRVSAVAKEFGVSKNTVRRAVNGETWKHVEEVAA